MPDELGGRLIRATLLWFAATAIAVGLWSGLVVATDRDPMNYADAQAYYRFEANHAHWSNARLDQKLAEVRWELFHWIVSQARVPVLMSALSIPLLAWLLARAGRDRWLVSWTVVGFAILFPLVLLPAGTAIASQLATLIR